MKNGKELRPALHLQLSRIEFAMKTLYETKIRNFLLLEKRKWEDFVFDLVKSKINGRQDSGSISRDKFLRFFFEFFTLRCEIFQSLRSRLLKRFIRKFNEKSLFWADSVIRRFGAKVGCVFPMLLASILPHAGFGPNDHRKDTPTLYMDQNWNQLEKGLLVQFLKNAFQQLTPRDWRFLLERYKKVVILRSQNRTPLRLFRYLLIVFLLNYFTLTTWNQILEWNILYINQYTATDF